MYRILTRIALAVTALVTAGILLVAAAGFLVGALYLFLLTRMSAPLAALATAGAALAAALLVLAIGCLIAKRVGRTGKRKREGQGFELLGEMLGRDAAGFLGTHPGGSALAALLAGFVVGISPRLRQSLLDLLKILLR